MADSVDWGSAENQLKQKSGQNYDPTMLADLQRNSSYGAAGGSQNVDSWIDRISGKANLRSSNEPNSTYVADNKGGYTVGPTGKVNGGSGSMGAGAAGAGGGSGQPGGGSAGSWWGRSNDLYSTLMGRAGQSLNVNPQDPIIANQVNSARADQTRQSRNYVDQMAEAGGPNRNLDTEKRMASEHVAQNTGNLQSQLVMNELTARRTEIQNALSQAGSMISDEERMALQEKLAMLDASLQQQSINNQYALGKGGLANQLTLGLGQLGLGQQQLNSNNDQFAANFGANQTQSANYWDWLRTNGGKA